MFVSTGWKDYELLDCSYGERLERWGEYILIRPDPQVIWKTEKRDVRWYHPHGVYTRSSKGGGNWTVHDMPEDWIIGYGDLSFRLRPMGFKHTGLFPEQAANWDWFSQLIRQMKQQKPEAEIKVLNLFAYTGGATAAAAQAGAAVCHVDASKGMVIAAKENLRLSGLEDAPVRYIVDDCRKFVERELRRGNRYDGVIMDPPSYGRGPNGEIWKLEDSAYDLIRLVVSVLKDDPLFFLINSYTTGLSPASMAYMLMDLLPKSIASEGMCISEELGIPVTSSGLFLPAGASCRFTAKRGLRS